MEEAFVAGVGMARFSRPSERVHYRVMGVEAIRAALADAGIAYGHVQQAYASYVFGETCAGQRVIYDIGLTQIPIFNVNNACASGSSALYLGRQAIASGEADCVLVVGFEQMASGAIQLGAEDRETPTLRWIQRYDELGIEPSASAIRMFGSAGAQYLDRYGATPELFAEVAVKNRRHAAANPYALFNSPITVEEVMRSPRIFGDYLTRLMACPPTCGSAAAVLCSKDFVRRHAIGRPVRILGQAMATDDSAAWKDPINMIGAQMTRTAASRVYEATGVGPSDITVVELHDCFATNEVVTYEGLGLCGEGGATRLVADGDNTWGGKWVVNPSGGLMSKGHPIGATGVAQCAELVWQMRGEAGARQVPDARFGLQHNLGIGGAAVVTLYSGV
jgi:acetyl-CoA acetyltransferase